MARILGIVNITRDSYSDGGLYLEPQAALAHARALVRDGAAMVDLGAQSSHPDAEDVSVSDELRRLEPLIAPLAAEGVRVSVDTREPEVMARALQLGAVCINDITALRTPGAIEAVRDSDALLILMHSTAAHARAERVGTSNVDWIARVRAFFHERSAALDRAGIARERWILDPGMGFFLSTEASASLAVLRRIGELREFGVPLCVGASRKSFIGSTLGRATQERGAGTLASELWCAEHGVAWIRTHDVRALSDALRMRKAIEKA
jgi:dihydropteroate synthase